MPEAARQETTDFFHGGRIRLIQPAKGFRAGMDSVLLAAAIAPEDGAQALELGCGAGAVLICAAARARGAWFTGVEHCREAFARAQANVALNGLEDRIALVAGDVAQLPPEFSGRFRDVFANPPFAEDERAMRLPAAARRASLVMDTPVALWIEAARRALARGGMLTLIHRADHVGALLAGFAKGWGALEIVFVFSRPDRPARRILVRARRDARAAPKILPPLVLHRRAFGLASGSEGAPSGAWTHSAEALAIQAGGAFDWTRGATALDPEP